jgi:hypothetical protein
MRRRRRSRSCRRAWLRASAFPTACLIRRLALRTVRLNCADGSRDFASRHYAKSGGRLRALGLTSFISTTIRDIRAAFRSSRRSIIVRDPADNGAYDCRLLLPVSGKSTWTVFRLRQIWTSPGKIGFLSAEANGSYEAMNGGTNPQPDLQYAEPWHCD